MNDLQTKLFEKAEQKSNETKNIAVNIFKIGLLFSVTFVGYKMFVNRFTNQSFDSNFKPATISKSNAKSRAEAIYKAMYGFGNGFRIVLENLKGLSKNDYIKVYNEFGARKGQNDVFNRMDLNEWIIDQFNETELLRLRLLISNQF